MRSTSGPGSAPVKWVIGSLPTPKRKRFANIFYAADSSCSTISGAPKSGTASTKACGASSPTARLSRSTTPTPIFHTVYDLDDRYQVPGQWALRRGTTYRADGEHPHWQGIYDDHHRVMVAISFNSDLGDSWEWADDPSYPERYSALGIRIGVNYVTYAMTH